MIVTRSMPPTLLTPYLLRDAACLLTSPQDYPLVPTHALTTVKNTDKTVP